MSGSVTVGEIVYFLPKPVMRLSLLLIGLLLSLAVGAQNDADCPCCTPHHQQFDFWQGEWVVKDTAGQVLGENSITVLEDGCLIAEYWRGAQGGTGRSYNYFDSADSTWHQLWVSSSGHILRLRGTATPGQMVLTGPVKTGTKGPYRNRITWTQQEDGTVVQQWDILTPDKQPIRTAFYGIYYPKEE